MDQIQDGIEAALLKAVEDYVKWELQNRGIVTPEQGTLVIMDEQIRLIVWRFGTAGRIAIIACLKRRAISPPKEER